MLPSKTVGNIAFISLKRPVQCLKFQVLYCQSEAVIGDEIPNFQALSNNAQIICIIMQVNKEHKT